MTTAHSPEFTGRHMLLLVIGFFGVIIVVNIGMAIVASTSWTGLVVQNSYVASQEFEERRIAHESQQAAGWQATLTYSPGVAGLVIVDGAGQRVDLGPVTLKVNRPVGGHDDQVVSMERVDGRWLVNGTISAALVIGAGGHFCPVVRFLGANLGKDERAICAQEIEFEMSDEQALRCGVEHDRPELYFCDDLKGYGWCFRKGNFLNVGLGREGNKGLVEHVHAFSQWLQSQGKVPADAPARFKGHAYLLYSHAKRPVIGDGVLIIGDAAGLAYAESGEGIRPAIESGLMAARIIANARGDYSKQRLSEYEAQLAARFGARNNRASLASSLPESWKLALARSLMQTQWFTRNVVINRWFLHADQAALRA